MRKSLVLSILGLSIAGMGLGAGFAFALVSLTSKSRIAAVTPNPPVVVTDAVVNSCQPDALTGVTYSLASVSQLGSIAQDPLSTVASFGNLLTPDLLATFNPVPWPAISDRARAARVPVIMYHDITPVKKLSYDVLPEEFAAHLKAIHDAGLTPITMDQLFNHLRTGASLPEMPILLTFDDNYLGQYQYAYPLLKQYGYPALFAVHTGFVGKKNNREKSTWDQLREMQQSGLITIASHTINHLDLAKLDPAKVEQELRVSKQVLEKEMGVLVRYFVYPFGTYNEMVKQKVTEAGYEAALTMSNDPYAETTAGKSEDLLTIMRYGQSRLFGVIPEAWGGPQPEESIASAPPGVIAPLNFNTSVRKTQITIDNLPLTLVYGGRPATIHADTRAQVEEIMKFNKQSIAAVDGGFFSLESLQGNTMIGPVLSQFSANPGVLNPGKKGENPLLKNRPLVLINNGEIKFVPYDPTKHSTLEGMQADLPGVTDAFVGAGWLVRNGKPQEAASFGKLYGFDASRDRAFWGVDRATGRPVIGVTMEMIDSVGLGKILAKAGLQDVVMLDSGASAALAYRGKSVMAYDPRPVPHVVTLMRPERSIATQSPTPTSCPANFFSASSNTSPAPTNFNPAPSPSNP